MPSDFNAAVLLREARRRAGLTQREVARRAGTSQSVIARIERGQTDPATGTLVHLLAAIGFELDADLVTSLVSSSHMLDDVARILRLTPERRLIEVGNVSRFMNAARRV